VTQIAGRTYAQMQHSGFLSRFYYTTPYCMTMLEYCKLILQKVSFDISLFRKEFQKAMIRLLPEEVVDLKLWCLETFGQYYCLKAQLDIAS